MLRASLEIALRTGTSLVINFEDDEAVNAVVERLKKSLNSDTVFAVDIQIADDRTVVHYLPPREIVRFAVTQHPRVAAPT